MAKEIKTISIKSKGEYMASNDFSCTDENGKEIMEMTELTLKFRLDERVKGSIDGEAEINVIAMDMDIKDIKAKYQVKDVDAHIEIQNALFMLKGVKGSSDTQNKNLKAAIETLEGAI